VLDNLMLGRHVHMRAGVLSSFIYWGLAQRRGGPSAGRVEDIIDFLKIQDHAARPTGSLAYGLQKRVSWGARWRSTRRSLLWLQPMARPDTEDLRVERQRAPHSPASAARRRVSRWAGAAGPGS